MPQGSLRAPLSFGFKFRLRWPIASSEERCNGNPDSDPSSSANQALLSSHSSTEENASPEARNALVLERLGDVRIVALSIARRLPRHIQLDDLIQAGTVGLIDAITRFDRRRPVGMRQYVRIRITGAILDSLREQDWASRYMRSKQQKLHGITNELEKNLGRAPESNEVAEAMGMDLQSFYEFAAAVEDLHRLEDNETEDQPSTLDKLAQDPAQSPDSLFARAELQNQVRDAMGMLKAEHRRVLRMYYFEEQTMSQIAREMHLTESRISQIHARALIELQAQLQPGTKQIH